MKPINFDEHFPLDGRDEFEIVICLISLKFQGIKREDFLRMINQWAEKNGYETEIIFPLEGIFSSKDWRTGNTVTFKNYKGTYQVIKFKKICPALEQRDSR